MPINYNAEDLQDYDGIAAVIRNEKGEILMQEHVKFGFWTIPVGKVKKDQSIVEGLKQEVLEECDLEILEYVQMASGNYEYLREGINVKVAAHLFEITKYSGEMKNMEPLKHTEQKFMPLEQIVRLPHLSDMTLLYLEKLGIKHGGNI